MSFSGEDRIPERALNYTAYGETQEQIRDGGYSVCSVVTECGSETIGFRIYWDFQSGAFLSLLDQTPRGAGSVICFSQKLPSRYVPKQGLENR